MFAVLFAAHAALRLSDLRPSHASTEQLHVSPSVHLTRGVISKGQTAHVLSRLPASDAEAWQPCIGQTHEFAFKKCALVYAPDDVLASMRSEASA